MSEQEIEKTKDELKGKGYIEVDFYCGLTLDQSHPYLMRHLEYYKQHGYRGVPGDRVPGTFGVFNCWVFTSDMSVDDIYQIVHHQTKAEYDEKERKEREEHKAKRKAYEARIPELTVEYTKMCKETPGFKVDDEKELEESVKALLSSIYETGLFLDILRIIQLLYTFKDNKDWALSEAYAEFNNQGHSGNTAAITARWIRHYSEYYGQEFFYKVFPEAKQYEENKQRSGAIID